MSGISRTINNLGQFLRIFQESRPTLFYGVIAAATVGGVMLCFTPVDPVRELFWSAVLNGVIAVPIMAVMMLLASRQATMGEHVIGHRLRALGWIATAAMAATVLGMLATF